MLASTNMPAFTRSAMDGYAIRCDDVKSPPVTLKVVGSVEAGGRAVHVSAGQSVRIMTGAQLPAGADTVVMKEKAVEKDGNVTISHVPARGENIWMEGEDVAKGEVILRDGQQLGPAHLALAASNGNATLEVYKQPRICVISTGSEIVDYNVEPKPGQVRNSSIVQLEALLARDGLTCDYAGIVGDDAGLIAERLGSELRKYDVVISTGGVSAGDKDLIIPVAQKLGIEGIFHQVMIKPGRPVYFGRTAESRFFGLPGNPVATYLGYLLFVRTLLFGPPRFVPCTVDFEHVNKSDMKHFIPVQSVSSQGVWKFERVRYNGSSDIAGLSRADHFIMVDENKTCHPGDNVLSLPL